MESNAVKANTRKKTSMKASEVKVTSDTWQGKLDVVEAISKTDIDWAQSVSSKLQTKVAANVIGGLLDRAQTPRHTDYETEDVPTPMPDLSVFYDISSHVGLTPALDLPKVLISAVGAYAAGLECVDALCRELGLFQYDDEPSKTRYYGKPGPHTEIRIPLARTYNLLSDTAKVASFLASNLIAELKVAACESFSVGGASDSTYIEPMSTVYYYITNDLFSSLSDSECFGQSKSFFDPLISEFGGMLTAHSRLIMYLCGSGVITLDYAKKAMAVYSNMDMYAPYILNASLKLRDASDENTDRQTSVLHAVVSCAVIALACMTKQLHNLSVIASSKLVNDDQDETDADTQISVKMTDTISGLDFILYAPAGVKSLNYLPLIIGV